MKVVNCYFEDNNDKDNVRILFEIEWKKREDGTKPENSSYTNDELKNCKNRNKFLFKYYESKIVKKPKKKV